jgi:hypothetical protein
LKTPGDGKTSHVYVLAELVLRKLHQKQLQIQCNTHQNPSVTRHRWLTTVILATQEAEIRKIIVWGLPRQIVNEILSQKHSIQKRAGRMAQVGEHLHNSYEALSSNSNNTKKF